MSEFIENLGSKNMEVKVAKLTLHLTNVAEIDVSPRSSSLRTFRAEERLRLSDRNSILMT